MGSIWNTGRLNENSFISSEKYNKNIWKFSHLGLHVHAGSFTMLPLRNAMTGKKALDACIENCRVVKGGDAERAILTHEQQARTHCLVGADGSSRYRNSDSPCADRTEWPYCGKKSGTAEKRYSVS